MTEGFAYIYCVQIQARLQQCYLNIISVCAFEVVDPAAENGFWVSLQQTQEQVRHKIVRGELQPRE